MKTYLCLFVVLALALSIAAASLNLVTATPMATGGIPDVSSALHVFPPLGQREGDAHDFDPSLLPYLSVSIWQLVGEDDYVERTVFTAEEKEKGLGYVRLQGDRYHVNWNIAKEAIGQQLIIHVTVAGLNVGYVAYTPATGRTMPISFRIDNHPAIRARVLTEQGLSALDTAAALLSEFQLGAGDIVRILFDEQFAVLDIGQVLRDVFGRSASQAAQLLADNATPSAADVAEVLADLFGMDGDAAGVAQILKSAGFSASEIRDALQDVLELDSAATIAILQSLGFTADELFAATSRVLAERFAPQLRFDESATTFPMSAQEYFEQSIVGSAGRLENTDPSTLTTPDRRPPTYFKAFQVGNQIRIMYWWYYGYQPGCWIVVTTGTHDGDWERVMVTLSQDASKVVAVTYWQHSGHYTRLAQGGDLLTFAGADYGAGLEFYGQHPVVYVGKGQHGSYRDQGGYGDSVSGGGLAYCDYFADWRNNNGNSSLRLDTILNLKSLADLEEPWMLEEGAVAGEAIGVGDGSTTAFDLDARYVTGASLVVRVDGVAVDNTVAQYSDGTGTDGLDQVVFTTAPASGAVLTGDWAKSDFRWGCGPCGDDGISTHPVDKSAADLVVGMDACSGMSETIFSDAGCYDSQCEYHDNQSWWTIFYPGTCSHCPSGYTDMGAYCGKGTWPWEWRTTSIHYYGLDYTLSQTDAGLLKTR